MTHSTVASIRLPRFAGNWLSLVLLTIFGFVLPTASHAQVTFNGGATAFSLAPANAYGLLRSDAQGNLYNLQNLYDSDLGNTVYSLVKLTPQADGSFVQSTLVSSSDGSDFYNNLAVDGSGNVYYTSSNHNGVEKLTPSGGGYSAALLTVPYDISSARGLAVDAAGDLFIFHGNGDGSQIYKETPSGGSYTETLVVDLPNFYANLVAVGPDGKVYVPGYDGNSTGQMMMIETPVGDGTYTQSSFGYGFDIYVQDMAVDGSGNLYISDGDYYRVIKETLSSGNYTQSTLETPPNGVGGIAVDSYGNVFFTDYAEQLNTLHVTSVPFGAQAVQATPGSSTDTVALQFTVTGGTTIGSVRVVTEGASSLDFTDTGSSTCTAQTYSVDTQCVVNANFTPLAPGVRRGAVVFYDGSGNPLVSVPLYGTGTGPQAALTPAAPITLVSGYYNPLHFVVDPAGDLYFVGNYQFYKRTPDGTVTNLSSYFSLFLTNDGAGNIIFSNAYGGSGSQNLGYLTPGGVLGSLPAGQYGQFNYSQDMTVDGAGNLYAATGSQVLKLTPSGVQTTIFTVYSGGFTSGVAVDAAGNVYVSDSQNNSVYKVAPDGTTTTVVSGLGNIRGIALDAAGNIYVADFSNGQVDEVSPAGVVTTLESSPGSQPWGVAVDRLGNVYYSEWGTQSIYEIVRSTSALTFATTQQGSTSTDSPQTVSVQNTGNAPLNFIIIPDALDFPLDRDASNACAVDSPVAVGSSCGLTFAFSPVSNVTTSTLLTEPLFLTTNNAAAPNPSITLSGTETPSLPVAAAPVFSVPSGTYNDTQYVTLTTTSPGAVIIYSLNGSYSGLQLYTGPIAVRKSTTLIAAAGGTGYTSSGFVGAQYSMVAATPVLSPAPGTYTTAQTVTITSASPSAGLQYTISGPNPITTWTRYTGPITVSGNSTIKVQALQTGYTSSPIVTGTYNVGLPPAVPTFSPGGGTYNNSPTVTISDTVPGATFYYTLNGATPTTASSKYTGPIAIRGSYTLKAIAVVPGYAATDVASAAYSLEAATPVLSPAPGTYTTTQMVSVTTASTGAGLVYTLSGPNPVTSWTKYTGPIAVSGNSILKVQASQTGFTSSAIVAGTYNIGLPPEVPIFSAGSGVYNNAPTVTISETVPGTTIYYTLNGATPTTASNKYTGPLTIRGSYTLKAIAVAPGYAPSDVASASYSLVVATPTLSLAEGTYTGAQTVTLASDTATAIFTYTTNGTPPTGSSTRYTGPITVSASETLKVFAFATGYTSSPVVSAAYTIQ